MGILLRDIDKEEVHKGQVLSKVNTIGLYNKFKANIYLLTKEEGGRDVSIYTNEKLNFYIRNVYVPGVVELASGIKKISSGDRGNIIVELENSIAVEIGNEFYIRDGARTIGKINVTEIIK